MAEDGKRKGTGQRKGQDHSTDKKVQMERSFVPVRDVVHGHFSICCESYSLPPAQRPRTLPDHLVNFTLMWRPENRND